MYNHLGSFASLGSEQAALELPGDFVSAGLGTMFLWYGVYFSNCVSWRNKFLVCGDWFKKFFWGARLEQVLTATPRATGDVCLSSTGDASEFLPTSPPSTSYMCTENN